jgi:hypothetical protein
MEEEEAWKDVSNYDNYEVSNLGRVRNNKTGRILHLFTFQTPI